MRSGQGKTTLTVKNTHQKHQQKTTTWVDPKAVKLATACFLHGPFQAFGMFVIKTKLFYDQEQLNILIYADWYDKNQINNRCTKYSPIRDTLMSRRLLQVQCSVDQLYKIDFLFESSFTKWKVTETHVPGPTLAWL